MRRFLSAVVDDAFDRSRVVASVGEAHAAIKAAAEHQPDLALLDVNMPGGGPLAARGIRGASPRTRVLAVSGRDDAATVREMLTAGASTFLVKGTPLADLVSALRAAHPLPGREEPSEPAGGIRVIVVDTDGELLETLSDVLERAPGIQLAGVAQTAFHATTLAARHTPDVAVVGSEMPYGGVARVAAAIAATSPRTRVIELRDADEAATASAPVGTLDDLVAIVHAAAAAVQDDRALVLERRSKQGTLTRQARRRRFERLHEVLTRDRLDIALQPIVSLNDGETRGYEALSRFPAPSPPPDVWFADAHHAGVGRELELLAIRSALAALNDLPADAFLSVNVSPDTVVGADLCAVLGDAGPRLVVELTEHAAVHDYATLQRELERLREIGVRIAVDDCGAGFASLRHVALLAPDLLKLDMFLSRGVREPVRAALTRALVGFAAEMEIAVVAEGIEAPEDLDALRALGVRLGQGYLLGRPGSPRELLATG